MYGGPGWFGVETLRLVRDVEPGRQSRLTSPSFDPTAAGWRERLAQLFERDCAHAFAQSGAIRRGLSRSVYDKPRDLVSAGVLRQSSERPGYLRHDGSRCLRFDEAKPAVADWNHEVHLQTLLVTEKVQRTGPPGTALLL